MPSEPDSIPSTAAAASGVVNVLSLSEQALADAMPQIVWAAQPDGTLDYYNRQWFEYIRLSPDAMDQARWDRYIHPDDLLRAYDAWAAALQSGDPYSIEFRVRRWDGEFRWFLVRRLPVRDDSGRVARWFGTCTDIHDQKVAEDALRHSRQQMEIVVGGANVGVWYCPLPFNKLIWDQKVKEHFHLPPEVEVTIDLFYERLHPDDRERTRKAIDTSIEQRKPYDINYRTVSEDGKHTKWIRATGRGFYDAAGNATRFDGITMDVTEREALLESERAARAEAERASRLKDEFLATLSHELRTPLNAILGWSQIMGQGNASSEDIAQGLEVIERNARAQSQIIEDLLDMSRIMSGKVRLDVQRLDLAAIVQAAVDTARPAADAKGIRLQSVIDPLHGVNVSGDSNRLQQVLWNLLSNAVKFTPRGGRVQVLLERVNSHIEISVVDTGEGIKPEFLPFVFDRFRQADASTTRRHGGLGLGLSIVKQLVELHGGSIRAVSDGPGQGSAFVVSLPLTIMHGKPDPDHPRRHPRAAQKLTGPVDPCVKIEDVRVLVVDDEPDARNLVRRLLEDCDAIVTTAASADEALQHLECNRFDVLVSDIGMPGQDGYALIRRVRTLDKSKGGNIPAIALTAYARTEDRVKAVAAGFQMHVAKPVEPTELVTMVAGAAGRTGK